MPEDTKQDPVDGNNSLKNADRDLLTLGIAVAAIILFVGTSGSLLPKIVLAWLGAGAAPDMLLSNAVLLNIALLIFGWRRHTDLQKEIAVRRQAEERARQLAEIDPLTSCLNRRSGCPAIEQLQAETAASGRDLAVLLLDLDNFKQINDIKGHRIGDEVLAAFAARVRALLPPGAVLARIGGDEFACALAFEHGRRETIEGFVEQVHKAMASPVMAGNAAIDVTTSIGIAHSSAIGHRSDGESLLHHADIAMYHAKKSGRNRHFWFEPQMEEDLLFRNELETGIRQGILAGEFIPYYEQQVDLETGELIGFEMLARWNSPRFGLLGPDTFIPVAEELDLISPLSEHLMRQAFADAREWDARLTLSVNISPVQLRDPWFSQRILKLLAESGFPPQRLEIEVTESCLQENAAVVRTMVTSLRNYGVRTSLDDFGTGYASLTQLRTLPFDRMKIDRSFLNDMAEDTAKLELVRAIAEMGRSLTLPVTAEGVESAAILDQLRQIGGLQGQGFVYGKPEDAGSTRDRLAALNLLAKQDPDAISVSEPPASGMKRAS